MTSAKWLSVSFDRTWGVVLLRLADQTPRSKTVALRTLLENYGHLLAGDFVVTSGIAFRINKFNSLPTSEAGP